MNFNFDLKAKILRMSKEELCGMAFKINGVIYVLCNIGTRQLPIDSIPLYALISTQDFTKYKGSGDIREICTLIGVNDGQYIGKLPDLQRLIEAIPKDEKIIDDIFNKYKY